MIAVDPGGGSTKLGVFRRRGPVFTREVVHPHKDLSRFHGVLDQLHYRLDAVIQILRVHRCDLRRVAAVISIGGPLKPLKSGIYKVTDAVVRDIGRGHVQTMHASLLGPLIAKAIADSTGIPAYFADPVSVDEFWPIARVTGLPSVRRKALSHALNIRRAAELAAARLGKPLARCLLVVAHLGTGISVAAVVRGKMVDTTNANEEGPFSPQRAGTLPTASLVRMCFSGEFSEPDLLALLQRRGGLLAHLGTDDLKRIESRVRRGDRKARLVYGALAYNVGKAIGSYAVALRTKPDAIVLTGGMARSPALVGRISRWTAFLSPRQFVFPGEMEMRALAERAFQVLDGKVRPKTY